MRRDAQARLLLYNRHALAAGRALRPILGEALHDATRWRAIRSAYAALIAGRVDHEAAATFFNSVTRRVLGTVGVNAEIEFLGAALVGAVEGETPIVAVSLDGDLRRAIATALSRVPLGAAWADVEHDSAAIARVLSHDLAAAGIPRPTRLELLAIPFYRNKGAYLVGRVVNGGAPMPVVIALVHEEGGVRADAVLTTSDEASVVFGFSWSYFHVAVEHPRGVVAFLASIMPLKRTDELYTAIGFHKHGKTELYRGLRAHLAQRAEQFERAPGQRGLVMSVIALPSFNLVLKIIRDSFGFPKRTSPRDVVGRYRYVFLQDRVGRLADAQEFERLELPRSAFPDALLAELVEEAPSRVLPDEDSVVIVHGYAQRLLQPLDRHLLAAPPAAGRAAILDYGEAIADLAHAGIFPGDMLLKNFGLSRHGRVIFYDYDEVQPLEDIVFREIPPARDADDDLAAEPWYSVSERDAFPEEWINFLVPAGPLREEFVRAHGALLTAAWWTDVQRRVHAGALFDVYPYGPERRIRRA